MRLKRNLLRQQLIALVIVALWMTSSNAQERATILAGHGTLSGSILPLWVGTDAKLFEKHGIQVRPIYLPRAAGRPALVSGDIQVYFSAGPPVVQMRLSGGDVAVTGADDLVDARNRGGAVGERRDCMGAADAEQSRDTRLERCGHHHRRRARTDGDDLGDAGRVGWNRGHQE